MSLFNIVKNVMDSNGWPAPTTAVATSQDQNMRQSFALANTALRNVSFKKDWPILMREHGFTTVAGQSEYPLPADFHHLVSPSAVNASQYYQLKGSLTPIQWYRRALNNSLDWGLSFRVDPVGKNFIVAPTPASPSDLVFMYITKNIAVDANGNPVTQFTQDNDVPLVDQDLIELALAWRWRQKKGLDFTAEMAEYLGTLNQRFAQYLASGELDVGGHPPGDMWPLTEGWVPRQFGV
jgi:hypothetical protein